MTETAATRTLSAVNDLARHNAPLADELAAAVADVVRGGWYVLGERVSAFEQAFAAYCGVSHAIGVASGTDALELALAGVGVQRGDRVALVANAGGYGSTAVHALGACPVYVDVHPQTHTIDVQELQDVRGVKAVIVTHLYGRMADVETMSAWARRHGVKVVEDCAQAHGASTNGRKAGAWGDAAAFSFYPTKNLGALGDAGAVISRDPDRIRSLRQYGWTSRYRQTEQQGRNSRLDEIQAAALLVKLPYLDRWNAQRQAVASRLRDLIHHPHLAVPRDLGVAHLLIVQVRPPLPPSQHQTETHTAGTRDDLARHLKRHGIPTDVHYPVPDHRQPAYADRFADVHLPVTERLCDEVLTLPCFPEMTVREIEHVAAAVNAWEA
jgi:aminotransferase EvaB